MSRKRTSTLENWKENAYLVVILHVLVSVNQEISFVRS